MGEYDRHHFVPQFYLRRFAVDAQQRQIGLYLIEKNKLIPSTSIRDQAQRRKLYGGDRHEKEMSKLEGAAASVIRTIVEQRQVPKWVSADHHLLMTYVLFQAHRTPTAAKETERANVQLIKKIMSYHAPLAPHIDQIEVTMRDPVGEALSMAAVSLPLAMDLRCKLLINRSNTPFLTSDHPVILYNQFMERRHKFGSGTGLACKGLQMFLPLSPDVCLMLFDYDVYKVGGRSTTSVQVDATAEDVEGLNQLQIANAGNQLYFNARMTERELTRLVEAAIPLRRAERSSVTAYPGPSYPNGKSSTLLHIGKTDLKAGLHLTKVCELRLAQEYRIGNRVVHQRDPTLCRLHEEFLDKVGARQYSASEFGKFMREKPEGQI